MSKMKNFKGGKFFDFKKCDKLYKKKEKAIFFNVYYFNYCSFFFVFGFNGT